jgi:hypothetical protein
MNGPTHDPPKASAAWWKLLVAGCIAGVVLALTVRPGLHLWPWSKIGGEVRLGVPSEILVMRTPCVLLEVSTIRAIEQFDAVVDFGYGHGTC